jgi:hypothetical protein
MYALCPFVLFGIFLLRCKVRSKILRLGEVVDIEKCRDDRSAARQRSEGHWFEPLRLPLRVYRASDLSILPLYAPIGFEGEIRVLPTKLSCGSLAGDVEEVGLQSQELLALDPN